MYDLNLARKIKRTRIKRKTQNKTKKLYYIRHIIHEKISQSRFAESRAINSKQSKLVLSQNKFGSSQSKFVLSQSKFGLSHFGGKNTRRLCTHLINTEYVIFNPMTSYSFQIAFSILLNFVYCVRLILRL